MSICYSNMHLRTRLLPVALALVVSACSLTPGRQDAGAPVGDISSGSRDVAEPPPRAEEPRARVYPMEPQTAPLEKRPLQLQADGAANPAIAGLLRQAATQVEQEQLVQAVATLERALRIESRNGHVWNLLAQVRFRQKQFTLAESMALKSNMLAPGDTVLQERNWRLIARSRVASGDPQGARKAEQKAAMLAQQGGS